MKKPSLTVFKPTFLLSDHRSLRVCFLKSLPVSKTLFQKHNGRITLILAVSGRLWRESPSSLMEETGRSLSILRVVEETIY